MVNRKNDDKDLSAEQWRKIINDNFKMQCIFKINTQQQIRSNLEWERDYRDRDLKRLHGTMICTYPVNNILFTISDSIGDYGKWMNSILELE